MMTTNDEYSKAYGELVAHMGGPENATEKQKHLCRVAVNLCQEIDAITGAFQANGDLEDAKMVAVINQLLDTLDLLGIPDPADFCRDRVH